MLIEGLGIDLVKIKRFAPFILDKKNRFLLNNYTEAELDYCFSFKNPAPHLAGTFAAKEAVFKSLTRNNISQSVIEIRRTKKKPVVWICGHLQKSVKVSISHTDELALAIAIRI